MLSYYPIWSINRPGTARLATAAKLGGDPLGFPAKRWPECAQCGAAMAFLGQFAHGPHLERIPSGHTLYLFKCEGPDVCEFWDPNAGANACLLLANATLTEDPTPAPMPDTRLLELWAAGWRGADDGISTALEPYYYDERFWDLPDELATPHDFVSTTKSGGVPYWTPNGPAPELTPESRVVLQIDASLRVSEGAEALARYAAGWGPGGEPRGLRRLSKHRQLLPRRHGLHLRHATRL